jgi:hypothetical protein
MRRLRLRAATRIVLLLAGFLHAATANATTYTYIFFNASQTMTVVTSSINSVTIRSGDYLFTYSVDGYWSPAPGGPPTGRFFTIAWPTGVQAQAITAGPLLGTGANITLKRADGKKFDLKSFTGKILLNTAGAGAAFEVMPQLNGEDAFPDPLLFDCTGYYGASFSYTPSLTNYDTYKIHMWGDFALTALTLMDTNPPSSFSVSASTSPAAMGTVTGAGTYVGNTICTLDATPSADCYFVNWTEGTNVVSTAASYAFTVSANRTLVANFALIPIVDATHLVSGDGVTFSWPASLTDWMLEESPDLSPGSWVPSSEPITTSGAQNQITILAPAGSRFFRLARP